MQVLLQVVDTDTQYKCAERSEQSNQPDQDAEPSEQSDQDAEHSEPSGQPDQDEPSEQSGQSDQDELEYVRSL